MQLHKASGYVDPKCYVTLASSASYQRNDNAATPIVGLLLYIYENICAQIVVLFAIIPLSSLLIVSIDFRNRYSAYVEVNTSRFHPVKLGRSRYTWENDAICGKVLTLLICAVANVVPVGLMSQI